MTPITGTISLGNIRTELGASGTISLGDTNVRRLAGKPSGTISLADNRACHWIGSSGDGQYWLTSALPGSPPTTSYRYVIASGINRRSYANDFAIVFGSFPSGSTITLDNYGNILGAGGVGGTSGSGGTGGHGIHAYYGSQTMIINNMSGATIYAGGGGGGKGGVGGTGGQGGTGVYYTTNTQYNGNAANVYVWIYNTCTNMTYAYWAGSLVYSASGNQSSGNGYYKGGTLKYTTWIYEGKYFCGYEYRYEIYVYAANYTTGGAGGAGGAGGNGGRGHGWDGTYASGSAGSGGSAGSAGGTNAGSGGYGGTGGTGGNNYGIAGNTGNTGGTGYKGNDGNWGTGAAGYAGSGGSSGGAAGNYLYRGGYSVTFNNYGSVTGNIS